MVLGLVLVLVFVVVGVDVCAGVVGDAVGGGASVLGFGVGGVGDVCC